MPVRRRKKVTVNTKQIIDIAIASIVVQKAPLLINSFIQLDPTIAQVAGAGVGYLAGVMFERPDIANASIALGAVELVSPMIDQLIGQVVSTDVVENKSQNIVNGGIYGGNTSKTSLPPSKFGATFQQSNMGDYLTLNDYVSDPNQKMNEAAYRDSY